MKGGIAGQTVLTAVGESARFPGIARTGQSTFPHSRRLEMCIGDLVSTENYYWREGRLSVPIRNSGGNIQIASDLDIIHCCDSEITPRSRIQSLAKRQMPDHGREPWRPFDCGNRDRSCMPNERRLKRAAVLSGERTSTGPHP